MSDTEFFSWEDLQTLHQVVSRDYYIRDEKNRGVGGYVLIKPLNSYHKERDADQDGDKCYSLTGVWVTTVQATRNGKAFGALRRETEYPNKEAALAAAPKLLDAQRKRYAKKYGVA